MTWEPHSPDEPAMVPLTSRMMAVMASAVQTPEEILMAREQLRDEEQRARRKLSREMTRALIWMGTEEPDRVRSLIDRFLPMEEAYMLRRYLLHRDSEEDIGRDMGVTGQGISYRLYRALWRLRVLQDVAWDLTERDIRGALAGLLDAADVELLVVFWRESFSQSRVARHFGRRQSSINDAILRMTEELSGADGRVAKRVHKTLLEIRRRKLWAISTPLPKAHAVRVPA